MKDTSYEIGYGKPPKQHQFKSGVSGNRKGRPRGSKNVHTLLNEILNQNITIKENGKPLRISKKAALLVQLVNKGVKGDIRAIQTLLPHLIMADMKEEEMNRVLDALNTDDKTIINMYMSGLNSHSRDEMEINAEDENCEDEH